ncbi:MAG: Competence protein ComM [Microgenomates bacterium OLB23]|nr:MAG: Competence protein ComM [Microgenomates bacterium OLB23]
MIARVHSATVVGMQVLAVVVEVDIAKKGFPQLKIVGLPGKSVEEAKERVRTALVNANYDIPARRIIVNLAPADVPKQSSRFDVPIAVGILAAQRIVPRELLRDSLFIGEISLNGEVNAVNSVLPIIDFAQKHGYKRIFVPFNNCSEAAFVHGDIAIYGMQSLAEIIKFSQGIVQLSPVDTAQLEVRVRKTNQQ